MRRLGIALAAVAVIGLLSGCHGTGVPTDSPYSIAPSGASASPTPSDSSGGSAAACTRDGLKITYQGTEGTAGHFHGILTFTNTGAACTMKGYPTVYVGQPEAEEPMGAVSTNDTTSTPALVNLGAGAAAHAAITITDAGVVCEPVDTTYLIAGPPVSHPFDWNADGEHVDAVDIQGCDDSTVSLVQVGAITN